MIIKSQELQVGDVTVAWDGMPMTGRVISVDFMERTMFMPPRVDVRFRLHGGRQFIKSAKSSIEIKSR